MRKIIAFGASSSKNSINKQFATFAAKQLENVEVEILDLNDYEMPIYSIDRENDNGIHDLAKQFKAKITSADGVVISFAEHNGSYSAAFKNVFDWVSRIEQNFWHNKPLFLLATSPGVRGGQTVLEIAVNKFQRMTEGGVVNYSLPSFGQNLVNNELVSAEIKAAFTLKLNDFNNLLSV